VSAYARPGHRCWHNLNYWQFGDYLGIGAGAHSKLSFAHRVVRQVRHRDPRLYMEKALAGMRWRSQTEVHARRSALRVHAQCAAPEGTGFRWPQFCERTGLPMSSDRQCPGRSAAQGPDRARPGARVRPTARGFDFLNDLQSPFSLKDWNAGQPAWALSTESIWSTDCAMV
jgi:coproporphyrinogen III oxidase-like Fe-S oxidoreductase